jgi:hypothetical protein
MDILKTPHQKLLEEAGAIPASPGMVNTPEQMLMQQSGIMPQFADGGMVSNEMTPEEMIAELIAANQTPQMFKDGGRSIAKKLIMPGVLAGLLTPDIVEASQQAKEGKYGEAAGTAGLIASGFLSGPLQAILMGMYPSELGKGTLDEYYAERVPGSVLPARLKPENMK